MNLIIVIMVKEIKKSSFEKNKVTKIIVLIVAIFLIIGILFAIILNLFTPMPFACTKKMCYPPSSEGYFEVPCNDCDGEGKYLFFTAIINFKKICPGQELMIFNDGELTDTKIDIGKCKYVIHFLR
jgi:hypothetical protein